MALNCRALNSTGSQLYGHHQIQQKHIHMVNPDTWLSTNIVLRNLPFPLLHMYPWTRNLVSKQPRQRKQQRSVIQYSYYTYKLMKKDEGVVQDTSRSYARCALVTCAFNYPWCARCVRGLRGKKFLTHTFAT